MEDARLAAALGRGADGALAVVFDTYAPQLYDYCLTFLADPDAAADAVHEALLVAACWAPALADEGMFVPWLHAITRNECLRKLRRGGRAYNVGISGDRPRPVVASRGRTDPVLREVTDLVNRYRFTPLEVAAALGISVRRARGLCDRSAAVLSRDRRTGSTIGRQARPGLPDGLRDRVLASAAMPSRVAYRGELAQPRQRSGFPSPLQHARARAQRRATIVKVAAVGLVLSGTALAIAVPAASRKSVLGLVQVTSPAGDDTGDDNEDDSRAQTPGEQAPGWEPSGGAEPGASPRVGQVTGLEGKCMDVRSSSDLSGTPVDLFPCNATEAQQWTVGDGTLRAFGKCLAITGAATGARAQLLPCTGDRAQRWNAQLDGALKHVATGRCLQVPSATAENFTVLTLGECTSQPNQIWRLPV